MKNNSLSMSNHTQKYDLDYPLIKFSKDKRDWWTVRDALRGNIVFGGIGSGKTSGSGRKIARELLKYGFGGIVLCVKPEERAEWESLVQHLYKAGEADRRKDIIVFSEDSQYRFNPLQYERSRGGKGAGQTFNLVTLLMNIHQMGKNLGGEGGSRESDPFWRNALRRMVTKTIDLLLISNEEVSIPNMHTIIASLLTPQESNDLQDILADFSNAKEELEKWGGIQLLYQMLP